jgi:hypothetical protein
MLGKIKNAIPLNWALLANPVNWMIVYVMIALAIAGLAFIISTPPASNEDE